MILFETIKNYIFLYIIGKNIKHENRLTETSVGSYKITISRNSISDLLNIIQYTAANLMKAMDGAFNNN